MVDLLSRSVVVWSSVLLRLFSSCSGVVAQVPLFTLLSHRCLAAPTVLAALFSTACSTFPSAKVPDECAAWNTVEFFETASVEMVRACLAAGRDANAVDDEERTPLMGAAAFGKEEQALALLRVGADVNARDDYGDGPLYFVAGNAGWHLRLVEALLAAGADPTAANRQGQTPLHVAALEAKPPQPPTDPGVIDALVAAGAAINARDNEGHTPLHYALQGNVRMPLMARLLAVGADVSARDLMENTPLHWAATGPSFDAVAMLLAAGADATARDRGDSTPLHRASYAHTPQTVVALLAAGADANARNRFGATPLHIRRRGTRTPR